MLQKYNIFTNKTTFSNKNKKIAQATNVPERFSYLSLNGVLLN